MIEGEKNGGVEEEEEEEEEEEKEGEEEEEEEDEEEEEEEEEKKTRRNRDEESERKETKELKKGTVEKVDGSVYRMVACESEGEEEEEEEEMDRVKDGEIDGRMDGKKRHRLDRGNAELKEGITDESQKERKERKAEVKKDGGMKEGMNRWMNEPATPRDLDVWFVRASRLQSPLLKRCVKQKKI